MLRWLTTMAIVLIVVAEMPAQDQEQSNALASTRSLPEEVATTMSQLLAVSREELSRSPDDVPRSMPGMTHNAHARFLELLTALNKQVNDDLAREIGQTPTAGIEVNLIEMARDYAMHPEHLHRLVRSYSEQPRDTAALIIAEHTTEEYRSAWELLVLSPPYQNARFFRQVYYQAIVTIRSDASIPVLVCVYENANKAWEPPAIARIRSRMAGVDEQLLVLRTLSRYCDAAALQAILRCVEMSEKVPAPLPKKDGFTMREWATRLLRDQENGDDARKWRELIEKQRQRKVTDAERAFLEDVLQSSSYEDVNGRQERAKQTADQ